MIVTTNFNNQLSHEAVVDNLFRDTSINNFLICKPINKNWAYSLYGTRVFAGRNF